MLRTWAEINLDHIAHNMKELRNFLGGHINIMAVVKAESYGHGAFEAAQVLLENGADVLGVATCDEGIKLRQAGISAKIIVLAHSPKERFPEILENDLAQTVSSLDAARELSAAAQAKQKTAHLHIKIDTGMIRIGFKPTEESVDEIMEISRLPMISIDSVFSHLAMSESLDKSFSEEQFTRYQYVIDALKQKGLENFKTHMCNSGGVLNNPNMHLDMVRPGLILYGTYPSNEIPKPLNLKPAMTLKSKISHLGVVDENESVGYDRTFYTDRKTLVATIVIGYADGYPSSLSNKASVIAGNGYAPIIGQICMDQMMVDVTDMPEVKVGDEVILFGKKNDLEITLEQLSPLCATKTREILCLSNLGKRIPRVYIKDGKTINTVML